MENHHFLMGKSTVHGPCSMSQTVNVYQAWDDREKIHGTMIEDMDVDGSDEAQQWIINGEDWENSGRIMLMDKWRRMGENHGIAMDKKMALEWDK